MTYAQSLIDDFSDPTKQPDIAVSVDMLDTGIDIPVPSAFERAWTTRRTC
jgi:type I site-specific restriction endonuclease